MSARAALLRCACLMPAMALMGCAASNSQATANPSPAPVPAAVATAPATTDTGTVVVGQEPESDHTKVDASNNQIYQAEHQIDPDAAAVSSAQNQGIP